MSKVEEVECFECNKKYFESKMITSFIDKHICYNCTIDKIPKQSKISSPVLDNVNSINSDSINSS